MINYNFYGLIIGFLFGICLMTIIKEDPEVVIKYPTPFNTKNVSYIDKSGNCYQYKANEINCPNDKSKIHTLPITN